MANLPGGYTKNNIFELQEAAEKFFPEELQKIKGAKGVPKWAIKDLNLTWNSRDIFEKYIEQLTETSSIVSAYDRLQQWAIEAPAQIEGEANTLSEAELKPKIEDAEKKEAERKALIEKSNREVRAAIERQKELYDKMVQEKVEKVYVEAKDPQKTELTKNTQDFISQAKTAPKEYVSALTENIEKSISPQLSKTLTNEQIHLMAENAAYKAVDAAVNPQKYIEEARQAAILSAVAKDKTIIPELVKNTENLTSVRMAATEMGTYKNLETLNPRLIFNAFNPELSRALFPNPQDFQVSFSKSQLPGYNQTFDPVGLSQGYSNFLSNQGGLFNSLARLPVDKLQSELTGRASRWIEGKISTSFPEISAVFKAPEAQALLQGLGIGGQITIELPASMSTFFAENSAMMPALNFVGSSLGIDFSVGSAAAAAGGEAAALAGGEAIAAAGTVGVEVAAGTTELAVGAAAAPATAGVSLAVAAVTAVVGPKVIKAIKDNVHKISSFIVGGVGALFGGGLALATGGVSIPLAAIFGFGTGFGLHKFMTGGMPAVQSSLSNAATAAGTAISVIWATFVAGIGTPILAFLVGFPVIVALMLFIINSGAYVVPPGQQLLNETNPYISVEKTASPNGQLPSPTSITYTVTISAKKDSLTGITITSECKATKKTGSLNCPSESIPAPPDTINAGTPFSFSFTTNYGSQYQDSLVSDSITVTAVSAQGGQQTEVGSASVCFGDCPLDCFDLNDPSWNQVPTIKAQFMTAASTISGQYPNFAAKVCAAGPLKLNYTTSDPAPGNCNNVIYARNINNTTINFNKCASQGGGQEGVLYILAHEVTHHIQYTNGYWFTLYKDKVPSSEWNICTYEQGDASEQMAEADALYIANPVIYTNPCGVSRSNFSTKYPYNYNFVKNYMYAP